MVSVELAGPTIPHTMNLIPNDIRGMAGWVIDQCVVDRTGSGGFVTKDLLNLIRYVVDPATDINAPFRMSTLFFSVTKAALTSNNDKVQASAFLTVTVSGPSDTQKPDSGDNDPSVPERVADYLITLYQSAQGILKLHYSNLALGFRLTANSMRRGGRVPWWSGGLQAAGDMTYECDSKLGSPKVLDCTQVRSQLGATSDSIQVGAGEVKFFSSSKNPKTYIFY